MNQTTIQIDSDVTGRIKRILEQVEFDGKTTFVTELLQNCQRSGATRVEILLDHDQLVVKDNGHGCDEPKDLFTLDVSGFGVGFGEGFSSVYTLLGHVHVHSLSWQGAIDMNLVAKKRVIKKEDLAINIEEAPFYQGFIVTLQAEKIAQYATRIERAIRKVSSTMMDFECVFNGEIVPKNNLYALPSHRRFHEIFDHSLYKGMLYVDTMEEYKGVDVYYEDRFVQNLYHGLTGVSGNIMIKKNKINLKAPDRTSMIWDEKRDLLQAKIEKDFRNLLLWLLKEGHSEEIELFADVIRAHIPVEKYVRFLQIDEETIKNQFEVRESVKEKEKEKEACISVPTNDALDSSDELIPVMDTTRAQEDVSFSSFVSGTPIPQKVSKDEMSLVNITNIKKKANVVWVEKRNTDLYAPLIAKYEYYGIFCFVSPHELYDDALRYLEITHIASVESEAIEKQYAVKQIGAKNKKEQRVMEILAMIEQCFELPPTFYLSDIECKMLVSLQNKRLYQEQLMVEGYHQNGVIHLNRKSLSFGKISGANLGKNEMNLHEVKFILANFELLTHELAHLLEGTEDNTLAHAEAIFSIQKRIGACILHLNE